MKFTASLFFLALIASIQPPSLHAAGVQHREETSETRHERDGVHFTKLHDTVWMHTTYETIEGWGTFQSNGLIVLGEHGAVLVDTAWNNEQTATIVAWTKDVLNTAITSAVFTHAHNDKMGGVQTVKDARAATYAHPMSNILAPRQKLVPAEFDLEVLSDGSVFVPSERPNTDLVGLEIFYAGAAHTVDNIVVKVAGTDILFGGCLIRQGGSTSLGYTGEASIPDWPSTVRNIVNRFPSESIVVPSHGPPAGRELLALTAKLAKEAKNKVD